MNPPPDFSKLTSIRIQQNSSMVEIFTSNLEMTLQQLLKLKISVAELRIRNHTLDNLFMELTGKELRS